MSGYGELFVQPSTLAIGVSQPGAMQRGIPTPGVSVATLAIPAVGGVPDCKNLLAAAPPTLLEAYELTSVAIGWSILNNETAGSAVTPNLVAELALLVNDRVRFITTAQAIGEQTNTGVAQYTGSGSWVLDLVNPIRLGARERLSLRIGAQSDQGFQASSQMIIGVQLQNEGAGAFAGAPFESTISYNVIELPASRRL